VALPTIRGDFNKQGPLINYYFNNFEYNDLVYQIKARADTNYKCAYQGYEEDVKQGVLSENSLHKHTRSIRTPSDFVGLSKKSEDLSSLW